MRDFTIDFPGNFCEGVKNSNSILSTEIMSSPELLLVRSAIELDGKNEHFAALVKYTEALVSLGGSLLDCYRDDNFTKKLSPDSSAKKTLFLVNQCVDRINALFKFYDGNEQGRRNSAHSDERFDIDVQTNSGEGEKEISVSLNEPQSDASAFNPSDDPMASAIDQNRRLMSAHIERMKRTKLTSAAEATMNMSLQRQLAENLELARQQKRELEAKKEKARQGALESLRKSKEAANLSEEEKQFIVDVRVFEADCSELRLLSYELNRYEKSQVNSAQFKGILDHYIDATLSNPDHPLCVQMRRVRDDRQGQMGDLESANHGLIRNMVQEDVDLLLQYFLHSLLLKPELKPKGSRLREKIEEGYFSNLLPSLTEYFRRACWLEVQTINEKLQANHSIPFDFSGPPTSVIKNAAKTFSSFNEALTPREMLKILVSTCKAVSCHESESGTGTDRLDSDDLICALAAIIMQSRSPDIVVWCAIMEEFIDSFGDQSVVGEEGFCLTSLRAAIQYVSSD